MSVFNFRFLWLAFAWGIPWMAHAARLDLEIPTASTPDRMQELRQLLSSPVVEDLPFAIASARADIQREPGNPQPWIALGDAYFLNQDYAQAAMVFWRAARLIPDQLEPLNKLGAALLRLMDYERARQIYEHLVERDPQHKDYRLNLGSAYHGLGRMDLAEKTFREVVRLEPLHAHALYNLGVVLSATDRIAEAADVFEQAFQAKPDDPLPLMAAARMHARLNQEDAMFSMIEQAATLMTQDQFSVLILHPAFSPWAQSERLTRITPGRP